MLPAAVDDVFFLSLSRVAQRLIRARAPYMLPAAVDGVFLVSLSRVAQHLSLARAVLHVACTSRFVVDLRETRHRAGGISPHLRSDSSVGEVWIGRVRNKRSVSCDSFATHAGDVETSLTRRVAFCRVCDWKWTIFANRHAYRRVIDTTGLGTCLAREVFHSADDSGTSPSSFRRLVSRPFPPQEREDVRNQDARSQCRP